MNPTDLNGIEATGAINDMYLNNIKAKLEILKEL
jgi:hypothetical protein